MKKESKKAYLTPSANFSLPCVKDVLLGSNEDPFNLSADDTKWKPQDGLKFRG